MKNLFIVIGLICAALLTGCGDEATTSASEKLVGISVINKGGGRYLAVDALNGINAESNFQFSATLQDAGSVTLFANSDTNLTGGIALNFARISQNSVSLSKNGIPLTRLTCSDSGEFTVTVEVHNSEAPAHILVWQASAITLEPDYEDEGTAGNGSGDKWGIAVDRATLQSLKVGPALHSHGE